MKWNVKSWPLFLRLYLISCLFIYLFFYSAFLFFFICWLTSLIDLLINFPGITYFINSIIHFASLINFLKFILSVHRCFSWLINQYYWSIYSCYSFIYSFVLLIHSSFIFSFFLSPLSPFSFNAKQRTVTTKIRKRNAGTQNIYSVN